MKYRKKPVVIDAIKWDGKLTTVEHLNIPEIHQELGNNNLYIPTLEGVMRVDVGDYIIKGVRGEFYPCKPDIFEMTYDKVEDIDK